MIFRILKSPPGYPSSQAYIVSAYSNENLDSIIKDFFDGKIAKFAADLDESRKAIPHTARRLHFVPTHQFLELWEATEGGDMKRGRS